MRLTLPPESRKHRNQIPSRTRNLPTLNHPSGKSRRAAPNSFLRYNRGDSINESFPNYQPFMRPASVQRHSLPDLFADPPSSFRGRPFWSWNGRLEREELLRQVRVFKEMGMGGFFMHSRTGLKTQYLG